MYGSWMAAHKGALEKRCTIVRWLAAQGGRIQIKTTDLSKAIGMPTEILKDHMTRLELYGVVFVDRVWIRDHGRQPNIYVLKHDERWLRDHADELERHHRKLARDATVAARRAEEARVDARRAAREEGQQRAKKGAARRRVGLPSVEPPVGVPDTKPVPVSAALKKRLIEEGMNLPAADLAIWGA